MASLRTVFSKHITHCIIIIPYLIGCVNLYFFKLPKKINASHRIQLDSSIYPISSQIQNLTTFGMNSSN
nr:MAG TPA: hypothetical protein [Caudoviricetes sp.]